METDSLELRIERIKNFGNLQLRLLKCFYNGRSIMENYLNGDYFIHVHALKESDRICATYMSDVHGRINEAKASVFVGVGDVPESLCPVASTERLQMLDCCDVLGSETIKTPFTVTKEFLFRVLDKKLRILDNRLGTKAVQLINEIVEGRTQVVDNLANENTNPQCGKVGGNRGNVQCSPSLATTWQEWQRYALALYGNTINLLLPENFDPSLQITQVFACPCDPLISAIQRVYMRLKNKRREGET